MNGKAQGVAQRTHGYVCHATKLDLTPCSPPRVVFEAILQPFGETQFAARIEAGSAKGGDQSGHGMGLGGMWKR